MYLFSGYKDSGSFENAILYACLQEDYQLLRGLIKYGETYCLGGSGSTGKGKNSNSESGNKGMVLSHIRSVFHFTDDPTRKEDAATIRSADVVLDKLTAGLYAPNLSTPCAQMLVAAGADVEGRFYSMKFKGKRDHDDNLLVLGVQSEELLRWQDEERHLMYSERKIEREEKRRKELEEKQNAARERWQRSKERLKTKLKEDKLLDKRKEWEEEVNMVGI